MEFRHGPMSLVDGEHLVVALLSEAVAEYEVAVLRDLRERGCHILGIAEDAGAAAQVCDAVYPLQSRLSEAGRGVLYLPLLQLLAYYRAMGRNLNPDRPRNVVMAVRLCGAQMI
jgi:glucosamine--fructose-6-phosphate aminotransferase (isomerizing)